MHLSCYIVLIITTEPKQFEGDMCFKVYYDWIKGKESVQCKVYEYKLSDFHPTRESLALCDDDSRAGILAGQCQEYVICLIMLISLNLSECLLYVSIPALLFPYMVPRLIPNNSLTEIKTGLTYTMYMSSEHLLLFFVTMI